MPAGSFSCVVTEPRLRSSEPVPLPGSTPWTCQTWPVSQFAGSGWYGSGWYGSGWYGSGWYGSGWYGVWDTH